MSLSFDFSGAALFVFLAAFVLAVPAAFFVLRRYRRAVEVAMMHAEGPGNFRFAESQPQATDGRQAPEFIVSTITEEEGNDHEGLGRLTLRTGLAYGVAGLAYAATALAIYFVANDVEFLPLRTIATFAVFAWPAILAVAYVVTTDNRRRLGLVVAYAAVLGVLSAISGANLYLLLWIIAGPATLALFLMTNEHIRTAAPFIFVILLFAAIGALISLDISLAIAAEGLLSDIIGVYLIALITFAAGAGVGWVLLGRLARLYDGKWFSDQMLLASIWMLIFNFQIVLFLSLSMGMAAVLGFLASAVFLVVLRAAFGFLKIGKDANSNRQLLLLRVFAADRAREKFLRNLGHYWRYLGSIELVGAPDVAAATLEPDELMAFLSGRLSKRFVGNAAELDARLEDLDLERDTDGRFRVNTVYCHDNAWRVAVGRLIDTGSNIVVDLRGFTPANEGIVYELRYLLNVVPLSRVILMTDEDVEMPALHQTLKSAFSGLSANSPNRVKSPVLRVAKMPIGGQRQIRQLIGVLAPPNV